MDERMTDMSIPVHTENPIQVLDACTYKISLSLPKTSSRVELLAVREIISHSARSSGSSFFRWFASHLWSSSPSLFAHPEPDPAPNSVRGRESPPCVSNWPSSIGCLLSLSSMSRYSIIAPSGSVAPSSARKSSLAVSQM